MPLLIANSYGIYKVVTLAGEGWNIGVSGVVVHSTFYESMISLLASEAYRRMAHTATPPLDESPFRCFSVILLWLQNSPSFAQTELLPIHA